MWFTTDRKNKTNIWSISLAVFSTILASFLVIYTAHDKYDAEETSTYPAVHIDARNAIKDWAIVSDIYRKESGRRVNVDNAHDMLVSSRVVNLTKKVPLKEVFANPNLVVYEKYTIKGKVKSRVRTNKTAPNYMEIKTNRGNVRVYYLYVLPYEKKGDVIEITGVILGKGSDKGPLIMISENKLAKKLDK